MKKTAFWLLFGQCQSLFVGFARLLPVAELLLGDPQIHVKLRLLRLNADSARIDFNGFLVIPVALIYIAVMVMIGFHLSHGIWSMFQSIGFSHPRYTPMIRKFAAIFSWILIAGFISVPLAVLAGLVR